MILGVTAPDFFYIKEMDRSVKRLRIKGLLYSILQKMCLFLSLCACWQLQHQARILTFITLIVATIQIKLHGQGTEMSLKLKRGAASAAGRGGSRCEGMESLRQVWYYRLQLSDGSIGMAMTQKAFNPSHRQPRHELFTLHTKVSEIQASILIGKHSLHFRLRRVSNELVISNDSFAR